MDRKDLSVLSVMDNVEDGGNDGQERRLVKGAAVLNPRPILQDSTDRVEEVANIEQAVNEVEQQIQDLFIGGDLDGLERRVYAYVSNARVHGIKGSIHLHSDEINPRTTDSEKVYDPRSHKRRNMAEHRSGINDDERRQQAEDRIMAIDKELAKDTFNVAVAIKEMVDDQTPDMLMHCARMY